MHNTDICALIDISSSYKFRRIILCRKNMDQNWVAQQIILLSDKIFVLSASALAEYFGKTLSSSFYTEEEFTVNDADIKGYSFVFNNKGVLCNLENNSTLVAVGHGAKNGENIRINNNAPVMGIYVLPLGKQIILESKDIMQEVL
jgi:hypothetical protein